MSVVSRENPFEHTLAEAVELSGTGLHTGVTCTLRLCPAPAGTGVVFRRADLENFEVEATAQNIARVSYATSLMKKGVLISTTEHLLAALYASGIDNVIVEIDNLEVPILDGSSAPFVEALERAGRKRQRRRRRFLQLLEPVEVHHTEANGAEKFIGAYPVENGSCGLQLDNTIDFPHPSVGRQQMKILVTPEGFSQELSRARTFTFHDEVEKLRAMGLIRGGTLDCAVVLNGDGVMNAEGLRYPDELVRHKTLDMIGDLALLGRRLVACVRAERAGHAMHTALVLKLLRTPEAWREVTSKDLEQEAVPA
jgi:UDP-3-O-[3-hydroxymyristoyl] N-acetylglucosamine deacetylase